MQRLPDRGTGTSRGEGTPLARGLSPPEEVRMVLVHAGMVVLAVLALAGLGRWVAKRMAQPPVIGEIAIGLVIGPLVVAVAGKATLDMLLPGPVLEILRLVGEVGLVLFLVGVAYHIRPRSTGMRSGAIAWVIVGAAVPSLVAGAGLAAWLLWTGDPHLRGSAPAAALILMLAVALTVTAVPVLARLLASRRMESTPVGTLALATATVVDAAMWLMLAGALALATRSADRSVAAVGTVVVGLAAMLVARRVLSRCSAGRWPVFTAVMIAVVTLAAAAITSHNGLTVVLGAVLVGIALPHHSATPEASGDDGTAGWAQPVHLVSRVGGVLVPVFFVATGIWLLANPVSGSPWALLPAVLLLAMTCKIAGTYVGARLAGLQQATALRVGVLMNTRGLTELAVLHAGLTAGVLAPDLFVLLVVVALATTVATAPLLAGIDWWEWRAAKRQTATRIP